MKWSLYIFWQTFHLAITSNWNQLSFNGIHFIPLFYSLHTQPGSQCRGFQIFWIQTLFISIPFERTIIITLMNNSHVISLDTDGPGANECSLIFSSLVKAFTTLRLQRCHGSPRKRQRLGIRRSTSKGYVLSAMQRGD